MRKCTKSLLAVVLLTSLLTSCSDKRDANAKNFSAVISQHMAKGLDLCLNLDNWPVTLNRFQLATKGIQPAGVVERMDALVAVGLATKSNRSTNGSVQYSLTDNAKPFVKEGVAESWVTGGKVKYTSLCYGKMVFDKVVKWEGPMKFGDYQEAIVLYTYKIDNLAPWATLPEIQEAFPAEKRWVQGVGVSEMREALKLTSNGWEVKVPRK